MISIRQASIISAFTGDFYLHNPIFNNEHNWQEANRLQQAFPIRRVMKQYVSGLAGERDIEIAGGAGWRDSEVAG